MNATYLAARKVDDRSRLNATVEARDATRSCWRYPEA